MAEKCLEKCLIPKHYSVYSVGCISINYEQKVNLAFSWKCKTFQYTFSWSRKAQLFGTLGYGTSWEFFLTCTQPISLSFKWPLVQLLRTVIAAYCDDCLQFSNFIVDSYKVKLVQNLSPSQSHDEHCQKKEKKKKMAITDLAFGYIYIYGFT